MTQFQVKTPLNIIFTFTIIADENSPPVAGMSSAPAVAVTLESRRSSLTLSPEPAIINNGPILERSRSGSKQSFHSPS